VTALRRIGFERVFDTCYGADVTVIEEGNEFLARRKAGNNAPMFTSCCPAWVSFAELNYPELLPNLSTCRSPMGKLSALMKEQLPKELNISKEDLVVVAVMPCTAKKDEGKREEFKGETDVVITTHELALMMKEIGITADNYDSLEAGEFDSPYGVFTGSSVIFGTAGGVSEAVLRYIAESQSKGSAKTVEKLADDKDGIKVSEIAAGGETIKLAAVSGLANTRKLIKRIQSGEAQYDLIEVMACAGGCVNGGGQPVADSDKSARRTAGLYDNDKALSFCASCENPDVEKMYKDINGKAHDLFHTTYTNRRVTPESLMKNC
jgi:NADH-quinone oxidoreductase subunit G